MHDHPVMLRFLKSDTGSEPLEARNISTLMACVPHYREHVQYEKNYGRVVRVVHHANDGRITVFIRPEKEKFPF